MRKIVLILSVIFLAGPLSACGLIPIPKEGLRGGRGIGGGHRKLRFL